MLGFLQSKNATGFGRHGKAYILVRHVLRTSTASLVQLAAPADARTSRAATGRTRPRVSPQPVVRGAPARSSRCGRPTRPRCLDDGVVRRCHGRHEARVTVEVHKPHQAIDRGPVAFRSVQTRLPRAQRTRRGRASRSRGSDAPGPPSSRSDLRVRRPRRTAASFVDDYGSASAGGLGDGAARRRYTRAGYGRPHTTPGSAAPPPTPSTRGKRPSPRTPARASSQRWSQSGAARARTARGRKTPRPRRIAVEREFARRGGQAWSEREAVTRCARGIAARGRRLLALAVLSVG